jgi:AraC-like DNA-binding protein
MGLPALLRDLDCDPKPVFEQAGFDLARFSDPDNTLPFVPASRLLEHCAKTTGCAHLGFLLGERADPSSLGLPGFMLRTAPDVGAALKALTDHLDLHDQGGMVTLVTKGGVTRFGYAIHLPGVAAADQIYDLSITIACRIMRGLCGTGWYPAEVRLARRPPPDPSSYRRFFRAPLRFNADVNALVFPARWLGKPLASADPLLHRHLEREAAELHSRQPTSLAGELRKLLRTAMAARKTGVSDIAEQLHLHERTLNRRLRQEGTTFRRELERVRYEVARQLLADTAMPLSKIAAALDYADSTAFSRAFKRWAGSTPASWRTRHR